MTLYERIGGGMAVSAAVDELYNRVLADPELSPQFDGVNLARLKKHQVEFMSVALGGEHVVYSGSDLATAHRGLEITDDQFERVVDHLAATLMHLGVDAELVGEVGRKLMTLQTDVTGK